MKGTEEGALMRERRKVCGPVRDRKGWKSETERGGSQRQEGVEVRDRKG
jgi:hypothetical protein